MKNLWHKFFGFIIDQKYEVVKWVIMYVIFGIVIIVAKIS